MQVSLVSKTLPAPHLQAKGILTADDLMVYVGRASSPQNQTNTLTGPKLLRYCLDHEHWSVFDMADMTIEVVTSRALSAQVVRHWSFDGIEVVGDFRFQEFSQRYAEVLDFETYEARAPHPKNRQASLDTLTPETKAWFLEAQKTAQGTGDKLYREALTRGIAKECARFLLPMSAQTTYYMKGTARSWLTYFKVRLDGAAQKEHRDIATGCYLTFKQEFPITAAMYEDVHGSPNCS